ncbi:MAG: DMT family transporter [Agathobaculum sp.]|jgi:DME family drug/metabolite transporter|uniref:DMT family transporter n=1 Tax=Agathobaculum sp. TaxID=2048138 RepID=UPI003D90D4CB
MKKARLLIIVAAICWGTIPVFYHIMSAAGLNSMQTITMRFSFAALGYVLYLLIRDRSLLRIKRPRHLLYFVGTGLCSLAFFNFCYITCIRHAGVAVAALLLYTAPAFVLLMSAALFREKLTGRGLLSLVMTVLGCAFVAGAFSGKGLTMTPAALLWGLGSGFGYALYSIFGKYALRHYGAETITAYTAVFAALATFPLSEPARLIRLAANPSVLLSALGCAVVGTVFAYLLYTAGLSKVPAGQASILSTVEPVVATILGVLLLKETMTIHKLCGIALVLGAIVVLNLQKSSEAS